MDEGNNSQKNEGRRPSQYMSPEMEATLREINATEDQWNASDETAKIQIDNLVDNDYKHPTKLKVDPPYKNRKYIVCVIGDTGAGKSATANTLLGATGDKQDDKFTEGSSAEPVTKDVDEKDARIVKPEGEPAGVEGADAMPMSQEVYHVKIVDTPGSWNTKDCQDVDCYIFVINLACPRFDNTTLKTIKSLKDTKWSRIVNSGRFVVALSHADSSLQHRTLKDYITEIEGDPLHILLTKMAGDRVVAVNNAAQTKYEQDRHQWALASMVLHTSQQEKVVGKQTVFDRVQNISNNLKESAMRVIHGKPKISPSNESNKGVPDSEISSDENKADGGPGEVEKMKDAPDRDGPVISRGQSLNPPKNAGSPPPRPPPPCQNIDRESIARVSQEPPTDVKPCLPDEPFPEAKITRR